jgi:hypothetical protein
MKQLIDKGIEQDIGWTRRNVEEYFDIYSDCYKDANGIRPRWDYTSDYYTTLYSQMVRQNRDETGYGDYAYLQDEIDEWEAYENEQFEHNMEGVTLNGEKPNKNDVEDRFYKDDEEKLYEECELDDVLREQEEEPEYRIHHVARLQRAPESTY